MTTKVTYTEKTQDWNEGATVYWFDVEGTENDGLYGVVQGGCDDYIVDGHGISSTRSNDPLLELCVITDEMIAA